MYSWQRSDGVLVLLAGSSSRSARASGRPGGVDVDRRQLGPGGREPVDQLVEPIGGPVVRPPGGLEALGLGPGLGDDEDRLADVVEEDHPVEEGERQVGQAAVVGRGVGQVLGVADRVVGGVADGPAAEPGQAGQVDRPVAGGSGREAPRTGRRPRRLAGRGRSSVGVIDDPAAPGLEAEERLGAEEAEPADLLAADDALEQERRARPGDPGEGRDGGQAVAVSWR